MRVYVDLLMLAANIIKPVQTHIYRKKYVNDSANSEEHLKKKKEKGAMLIQALIYPASCILQYGWCGPDF